MTTNMSIKNLMDTSFLLTLFSPFLIQIITITCNYLLNMNWYPHNPSLNLLLRHILPTLNPILLYSCALFVEGPFFVVSRFIQNQVGSIAFKSGEFPSHNNLWISHISKISCK